MSARDGGSWVGELWEQAADWLLLSGNRYVVAGLVLAAVAAAGFVLRPFTVVTPSDATPLFYLFSAILGGNLNLLTIVLAINQLVFSRELQPPGKFRDMEAGVQEFRSDVADATGAEAAEALPIIPLPFTRHLVESSQARLRELREFADGLDAETRRAVDRSTDQLAVELAEAEACLDESSNPTFGALRAGLEIGLSDAIHRLAALGREHGDELGTDGQTLVASLRSHVRLVGIAREYFKSLYTQEELSKLSLVLLLVGVPAEIVVATALFEMVGLLQGIPPRSFPPWQMYIVLSIGFAPLSLVFSYVLRAATIAHRSATTTQFMGPPRQDR